MAPGSIPPSGGRAQWGRDRNRVADNGPTRRLSLRPGQVDCDEPTDRVHRAVNVGTASYEEVTVFFLDRDDAVPQPTAE